MISWIGAVSAAITMLAALILASPAEGASNGCVSAGSGGDYFNALADCEKAGLYFSETASLVDIAEQHRTLLMERRGQLLQEQVA